MTEPTTDEKNVCPAPTASAVNDDEAREERREQRKLRHWVIQVTLLAFLGILVGSVMTTMYGVMVRDKDFETGFIGEIFKYVIEFLKLVLI